MRRLLPLMLLVVLGAAACSAQEVVVDDSLGDASEPGNAAALPPDDDSPMPVEPDGGIGDGAEPLPEYEEHAEGDEPGTDEPIRPTPREVEPHDNVVDPQPIDWDTATVDDEAGTVTVTWWSGVEPCTVLDRIDVDYGQDTVTITVWEGAPKGAESMSCIALAEHKQATVELTEDIGEREIVDGAEQASG